MAGLDLRGVTKVYPGGVTAVTETSFSIEDGEFIVLVGPSGCGKSTLLRMIAGLESITTGEIAIGERRVNELEPGERDIAMVFQNYALYPHMSVYDNMAYGLRNQGMPKAEIDQRIQEAAKTLHLTEYLDRRPRQLSGGQRQRVATGRAIVRDPQVFLFDEPLSNLDAKLRTHMRAELKELHTRLASTFIFVTHDQVEAMSLADRIIVLNAGRVEQIGRPMEIYDNPASLFVASFIGSPPMNIFPAASAAGQAIGELTAGRAPAGAAWFGARPEDITLSPPEGAVLAGNVALREVLGADVMVHVNLDGGSGRPEDRVIVRLPADAQHELPERVGLSVGAEAIYAFDADEAALPRG